jgi:hypothetical protein
MKNFDQYLEKLITTLNDITAKQTSTKEALLLLADNIKPYREMIQSLVANYNEHYKEDIKKYSDMDDENLVDADVDFVDAQVLLLEKITGAIEAIRDKSKQYKSSSKLLSWNDRNVDVLKQAEQDLAALQDNIETLIAEDKNRVTKQRNSIRVY